MGVWRCLLCTPGFNVIYYIIKWSLVLWWFRNSACVRGLSDVPGKKICGCAGSVQELHFLEEHRDSFGLSNGTAAFSMHGTWSTLAELKWTSGHTVYFSSYTINPIVSLFTYNNFKGFYRYIESPKHFKHSSTFQ